MDVATDDIWHQLLLPLLRRRRHTCLSRRIGADENIKSKHALTKKQTKIWNQLFALFLLLLSSLLPFLDVYLGIFSSIHLSPSPPPISSSPLPILCFWCVSLAGLIRLHRPVPMLWQDYHPLLGRDLLTFLRVSSALRSGS